MCSPTICLLPSSACPITAALALCIVAEALGALPLGGAARMARLIHGATSRQLRSAMVTLVPWLAAEPCLYRRLRALIAGIDVDPAGLTTAATITTAVN